MEELQQIPEVKEIYATERTAAIIEYHLSLIHIWFVCGIGGKKK